MKHRNLSSFITSLHLLTMIAYALLCDAIEIGRVFLPLIANMLFVSINVSLEKISVKFPRFVNLSCCVIFELNKFAYVC